MFAFNTDSFLGKVRISIQSLNMLNLTLGVTCEFLVTPNARVNELNWSSKVLFFQIFFCPAHVYLMLFCSKKIQKRNEFDLCAGVNIILGPCNRIMMIINLHAHWCIVRGSRKSDMIFIVFTRPTIRSYIFLYDCAKSSPS